MLNFFVNINYCYNYLIDQIPVGLLLYSHIPTALAAIFFGGYILYKVRNLSSITLFIVCLCFATWCFFDLVSWFAFLGSSITMFAWSLLDLIALFMFFFAYYFLYTMITGEDLPLWQKILSFIIILPTTIWTFLGLNLPIYDANLCEAIEDAAITNYPYFIEMLFILASVLLVFIQFIKFKKLKANRRQIVLVGLGVILFLVFFFSSTFLVSILSESSFSLYIYNYEIYGLFGMPLLLGFLVFLVVKYKIFNIKLIGAQALIVSLVILIGSQFLFVEEFSAKILISLTLVVTGLIGINLIISVKREVEQREQIEKQEINLKKTNNQLVIVNQRLKDLDKQKTEFVSFASHQLRSPLTAIKGYASLILEGDYGQVTDDLRKAAQIIFESTKTLAVVVDDYLNVSRIELGQMKYDLTLFDLKLLVKSVIDEHKPNINNAGLELYFNADTNSEYNIKADKEKLKQVIANVIDNSVKYTPKGKIEVDLIHYKDCFRLIVKDTGIGISKEVIPKLFSKFSRATNASKTNIRGTGLGLFIAKEIITANKGKIWVESEGEGKGSQFIIELNTSV